MRDWKSEVTARLEGMNLTPERELEIVEELSQHLEDRYQELIAKGTGESRAFTTALGELQEHQLVKELRRTERPFQEPLPMGAETKDGLLGGVLQDLKYAIRSLRSSPGFTIVAILSLSLGIGANTTIFQLLDAVRLRTLPVKDPQELAVIKIADRSKSRGSFNGPFAYSTYPQYRLIEQQQEGFSGLVAFGRERFNTSSGGEMRMVNTLWINGSGFGVLGLQAAAGRLFTAADDQPNCGAPGVVLSHSYWQREFGGDRSAIGSRMTIEGRSLEIIGVTPQDFFGLEVGRQFDVALPLCADPLLLPPEYSRLEKRQNWWLAIMGRLKPGWSVERAAAQLKAISPGIFEATVPPEFDAESAKAYAGYRLTAEPAATGLSNLRREFETPLWLLLGVTGLVLLIACANLANLLLARASARAHEIGVRIALGASRSRLIRQLLTESLLLAGCGALAGLLLARNLSGFLVSLISTQSSPKFVDLSMDWRMFAFTAGLAVLTCLLFGLMPALRATKLSPAAIMTASGRGMTSSRERFGVRRMLVVSQVALSLVLLVGALLFVRSFTKLMAVDAGFRTTGVLLTDVDFSPLKLPMERRIEYERQVLEKVRATPGIEASMTSITPVSGSGWAMQVLINGEHKDGAVLMTSVMPGYFKTMNMSLLTGRDFTDHDDIAAPHVAIVNQEFANKYLGTGNPIGKTFKLNVDRGQPQFNFEIVGLVSNSKYYGLREDNKPIIFFSKAQDLEPDPYISLVVRSDLPLDEVTASIKKVMAETSPAAGLEFRVLEAQIREGLLRERLMALLSSFFGILAAVLATVGLYGVISYMVVRRTNEIGIRMALGADTGRILGMIMREAGLLLGAGIAVGAVLSILSGRAAETLLFGLKPYDPLTIVSGIALLGAVATVASFLPARRAATLDPMVALREE